MSSHARRSSPWVRAADSEQDATIYLTAAFTGLRLGELLALRWRDVDFGNSAVHVRQNFTNGSVDTPKSGHERVVPMADGSAKRWPSSPNASVILCLADN